MIILYCPGSSSSPSKMSLDSSSTELLLHDIDSDRTSQSLSVMIINAAQVLSDKCPFATLKVKVHFLSLCHTEICFASVVLSLISV